MIVRGYSLHWDASVGPDVLRPRDVYLAGPFFNTEQEEEMQYLESCLKSENVGFFSPRLECRYNSKTDKPVVAQRAFALNRHHILNCTLVLAGLSWPDVGTAWELGYADAMKVPRLGTSVKKRKLINLMVLGTVDHMVSLEDVRTEVSLFFADKERHGRADAHSRLCARGMNVSLDQEME